MAREICRRHRLLDLIEENAMPERFLARRRRRAAAGGGVLRELAQQDGIPRVLRRRVVLVLVVDAAPVGVMRRYVGHDRSSFLLVRLGVAVSRGGSRAPRHPRPCRRPSPPQLVVADVVGDVVEVVFVSFAVELVAEVVGDDPVEVIEPSTSSPSSSPSPRLSSGEPTSSAMTLPTSSAMIPLRCESSELVEWRAELVAVAEVVERRT